MTSPRIAGSSPVVSSPELEATPSESSPLLVPPRTSNEVESFSPVGAFEAHQIESGYDAWFGPSLDELSKKLSSLNGQDLKQVLRTLDENGKLDQMLNKMTSAERQHIVDNAIAQGVVEREGKNGKLVAKQPVTESFHALLSDFNVLGPNRKTDTHYNWSASGEGTLESIERSRHNQIKNLKPGESVTYFGKASADAQHMQLSLESTTVISRDDDGKFRLAVDGKMLVGPEAHAGEGWAQVKAEGGLGAGARIEYTFGSALEAELAAKEFAKDSTMAARHYGKPAAIEMSAELTAELAAHFGHPKMQLFEVKAKLDASASVRLELDGKNPQLVFKASGRGDGVAEAALHGDAFAAELHAMPSGRATTKDEIKIAIPIRDPEALRQAPLDYIQQHGKQMLVNAEVKYTASTEIALGHHATERELSATLTEEQLNLLATAAPGEFLSSLRKSTELELTETELSLRHTGAKLGGKAGGVGLEVDFGFERKTIDAKRTLYKGHAGQR